MRRIDNPKSLRHADDLLKRGFASMLQGGVIMDVVTPDQAAVAREIRCSFRNGIGKSSC